MTPNKWDDRITDALHQLRMDIPELSRILFCLEAETDAWLHILEKKLLPRIQLDFPLTAAICGGGSSGKSTLFNSLINQRVSPSGGRAGMNRRILFAFHGAHLRHPNFLKPLFEPFGTSPEPLVDPKAMLEPGNPLYITCQTIPQNLAILDTPDFDTGAKGLYTNRDLARPALETADIFIYIFTNSNYNNRDNTEFISKMLADIGTRKCFLIYRVYPSFTHQEVIAHAMTVARNLYGDGAENHILGIYRADESNAVAAGDAFMSLRPARTGDSSFMESIHELNPRQVRTDLMASILKGLTQKASHYLDAYKISKRGLSLYLEALQATQGAAVRDSLSHFPMEGIMKRFSDIWLSSDPSHIKTMRRIGQIVELPMRWIIKAAKKMTLPEDDRFIRKLPEDFEAELESDLIRASNRLYRSTVDATISLSMPQRDPVARRLETAIERIHENSIANPPDPAPGMTFHEKQTVRFDIPAHPAVFSDQTALKNRRWKSILDNLLSQKDEIISITASMDHELEQIADAFRNKMTLLDRMRQTFSAVLNIIPATVAVTYILHTGDPAGAVGIKVKLASLFGLKDLYAMVAIPITAGLRKGDLKQIEEILTPLAQTWLNHKLDTVNRLFEKEMTGALIQNARQTLTETDKRISRIEKSLAACRL